MKVGYFILVQTWLNMLDKKVQIGKVCFLEALAIRVK
jgi:hypothetical protein